MVIATLCQGYKCSSDNGSTGVRQGCLLSTNLFDIFLKRFMPAAPQGHNIKVSHRGLNHVDFGKKIQTKARGESLR